MSQQEQEFSSSSSSSRWVSPPTVMPEGGRWLKINKVQYYPPQQPQDIYQPQYQHLSEEAVRKHKENQQQQHPEQEPQEEKKPKIADWEIVSRATTTKSAGGADASELVIIIKEKITNSDRNNLYLALIAQYRPPLDSPVLEFPAGLIDEGECPIEGGLRELSEETGIADGRLGAKVSVANFSPQIAYEPGMTSSKCVMMRIEVELPEGMSAIEYQYQIAKFRKLEAAELSMQMVLVPFDQGVNVCEELNKMLKLAEVTIDAKVWSFCMARSIGF